jgi:uncharacterized protein (DUF1800 family)
MTIHTLLEPGADPLHDAPAPVVGVARTVPAALPAALAAASAALAACGGGGEAAHATAPVAPAPPPAAATPTDAQASRFLGQASLGATRAQITRVKAIGYESWLEEQFATPADTSRWDWLVSKGYDGADFRGSQGGFDPAAWRKLIAAPDTLRQRVTLALSEIVVVGIDSLTTAWKQFAAAHWLDLLEQHAFGNLRTLIGAVSTHPAMGVYLTFRGNAKANTTTGSLPDENYARELMQLFLIGLQELQPDGTLRLVNGEPIETYVQDDITGLARVFTGWDFDFAGGTNQTPDFLKRPMTQVPNRYETGEKSFLGLTIPAGTTADESMRLALDHLYAHPNVGPFWSRQLIQRLVTSNPSPAYVQRVAQVFADDGSGQRGNLKAVVKAILLDAEARGEAALSSPQAGKLREPVLRFVGWARAFGATSASDAWEIGNTSDASTRLGQSPLRSPSVFNFFRPGYVPPNSGVATAGLVAPEFQITHESSVVGYLNWMQGSISNGRGDVRADYSALLQLATDPVVLVAEVDLLLAAAQLSAATRKTISDAINTMASTTDANRLARVHAAVLMVMAAPEYLVQK